ncbi:flagellar hook-associated protein 3 [Dissulfurirhabdus thermomarina]|uniref:Flagellar hook-associated protein 3 n=1 Tax=Dissulfurirhabdus thermomarina TaxID=1765737 RepID=A0A6N9TMB5_DISTH|nr:flagellar hook-associated protein FlgL [Dissulfurirhabdus thermomarina]NDY42269.1 flagellar hook-associated protein 3 [Dissulfurirhabdus thermomarina]NMX22774.1 flagellar hook-associated protein 3 [Dissulfurirhabdus thermomarina]
MRVTMNTLFDQIRTDLGRLTDRIARTSSTITSGKIYRRPSDAPVALTHALALRGDIADGEQYSRNISYGRGWAAATESALSQVEDRLLRAKSLAVQGANDTQDATSRAAIAEEVQTLLEEVVALGNTKMGDRYIFGGQKTRGYGPGEAPFVLDRDGAVRYLGDQGDVAVDVAPGVAQKINTDGKTALADSGAFEALDLLHDSLLADSNANIEIALADLEKSLDYLRSQVAGLGARTNTLDNRAAMIDELTFTDTERLSDIEDTDIVKAVADLQALQTSYQAALASAAKVTGLSLVNYI